MKMILNVKIKSPIFISGRSKRKDRCPNVELEQTEPCPCHQLLSQPCGNWSACILPHPPAAGALKGWTSERETQECGQGVRYRAVACVEQQRRLVDPTLCSETGRNHIDPFEDQQHEKEALSKLKVVLSNVYSVH